MVFSFFDMVAVNPFSKISYFISGYLGCLFNDGFDLQIMGRMRFFKGRVIQCKFVHGIFNFSSWFHVHLKFICMSSCSSFSLLVFAPLVIWVGFSRLKLIDFQISD